MSSIYELDPVVCSLPMMDSEYCALSWWQKPTRIGGVHSTLNTLFLELKMNRVLKYVKGAFGETDVPDTLPEFIVQRRRWLNGSFFAATYAIAHVGQILRSGHSVSRKIVLMIETVYNIINIIFAWFSIVGFLFVIFR
jgi:cellulose synthase/poly-beta-1,6-N-acetylglucosamine synthase-like glycosyltransferase